jgi:hypothetical protein
MYGGFDVFKVYLAVKLHFTTDYNYILYEGKVNCKLETFTKRNDRYFFHKLSTKYNKDEILDFFVANFSENSKKWVGNLLQNDGRETYLNYKKVKDNFSYHFRNDCINIYDYLFKRNYHYKPQSCLTKSYRLSKIGINKLKKRLSGLKSHIRLSE